MTITEKTIVFRILGEPEFGVETFILPVGVKFREVGFNAARLCKVYEVTGGELDGMRFESLCP